MKVEHIANSSEPHFYKKLSSFLAKEDIEIVDVKYSTTTMQEKYEEPIEYSALVLFENKPTGSLPLDYDNEYRQMHSSVN